VGFSILAAEDDQEALHIASEYSGSVLDGSEQESMTLLRSAAQSIKSAVERLNEGDEPG
jgi:hypothetical protein